MSIFCGLPSSEHREIVARQARHELPVFVSDDDVNIDVVDFHLEGDARYLLSLSLEHGRLQHNGCNEEKKRGSN